MVQFTLPRNSALVCTEPSSFTRTIPASRIESSATLRNCALTFPSTTITGAFRGDDGATITLNGDTTVTSTFTANPPPPTTQCVVPKLKGKKLGAAKIAIRKAHCRVGKVTKVKSTRKHRNRVLSQNPKPGKHLREGSKVALKVGT